MPTTVDVEAAVKNALERAHRPADGAQEPRDQRRQHPLLPQSVAARRDGARSTTTPAAIGGLQVERAPRSADRPADRRRSSRSTGRSYSAPSERRSPATSRAGACSSTSRIRSAGRRRKRSYARARLQQTQLERQLSSLELTVATQVREAARNVQTNAKRVDATRASRVLAEKPPRGGREASSRPA